MVPNQWNLWTSHMLWEWFFEHCVFGISGTLRSGRFVRQWLVEAFWFKKGLPNKKNPGLAVLSKNEVYTGTPQSATSSNQKDRRGQFTTIWAGFYSFYFHHVPIEWTQYQGLDAIVIDKPAATGRAGYWELFFLAVWRCVTMRCVKMCESITKFWIVSIAGGTQSCSILNQFDIFCK